MGSLGFSIAEKTAQKLGFRFVNREIINRAANAAGAHEMALSVIDELGLLGLSPSIKESQAYVEAVNQIILDLAQEGKVVLLGRAGQVILRNHPHSLHIRIIAPLEVRVSRVMQQADISHDAARARIDASDRARRRYLKRYYGVQWDDNELYDLVINTERFVVDEAVDLICQACMEPRKSDRIPPSSE